MKLLRTLIATGLCLAFAAPALAQQERTIRFGHLNNTDHPISFGVKKFAEIISAKSGGKIKVQELSLIHI